MIKAKAILGELAVDRYEETGKVPSARWLSNNDGSVEKLEFNTTAELDAYQLGLQHATGNQETMVAEVEGIAERKVICTRCGSADVSCYGIVNPNTMIASSLEDGAYCDGSCRGCGRWAVLSDVIEVRKEFERKYAAFIQKHGKAPENLSCEIAKEGVDPYDKNEVSSIVCKLRPYNHDADDESIFFYFQDVEEAKAYIDFTEGCEFVITEIGTFY